MSDSTKRTFPFELTESQWRERLTDEQYRVLRQQGTERAFTGQYHDHHATGIYHCAACGYSLFRSEDKFDSGTGWPSFSRPINDNAAAQREDHSFFMGRTEVICPHCGSHLGHVFDDGPQPTGLRYCINAIALEFKQEPHQK